MASLTFVAVIGAALGALAVAQQSAGVWNGNCGPTGACTRQGQLPGPQALNLVWQSQVSAANFPNGIMISADGKIVAGESGSALAPGAGLCPVEAVLNGTSGAVLFQRQFSLCPYQTTYSYGVTDVEALTAGGEPVMVTGQGWRFDNGSYVSMLFGASVITGNVLWNTTSWDGLYGDVVPSHTGHHVYTLFGPELRHINATDGSIAWSLGLPVGTSADMGFARKVVISPDDALAIITDPQYRIAIGVDLAKRTVVWTTDNSTLLLGPVAKPAFDAASGTVIIANVTSVVALDAASGKVAWERAFPDATDPTHMPPALALDAAGGFAFLYTATLAPLGESGTAVVYAVNKATGAVTGRYAFDNNTYSAWGTAAVIDATGSRMYVSVLGPLVGGAAAAAAAPALPAGRHLVAGSDEHGHSRALQGGGSVYIAALTWNDARTAVDNVTIVATPSMLQAGFPRLAMGPYAGQVTIATANGVAVLQD